MPDPDELYPLLVGAPERLRHLRRLIYRCASRQCLLLDAIEVPEPGRVLLHQKRFKNSDEVNQRRSSEAGRKANTLDGDRRWKPRTYYIGQSALAHPDDKPPMGMSLQCDHVGVMGDGSDLILMASEFRDDWAAGHAEVRVRPDGSRYAVH